MAYLTLLKSQLAEKGYEVIEAENGKDGLNKAKSEHPDLILLDLRLPVMSGMEMLDLLRRDEAGKKTKVIILTNLEPDDKIIGDVISNEPTYYFVKSDIHLSELLDKVKDLVGE